MKQPLFFRIYKDGQLIEIKQFQADQVVIGQNDDVEISLKSESLSPIHAMIEERESGFFICDLGSSSGTIRNGEKVLDAPIQSGDEVEVGGYRLEFYVGVPKPKSKPPKVSGEAPPPLPKEKDDIYDRVASEKVETKSAPLPPKVESKPTPKVETKVESKPQPKKPVEIKEDTTTSPKIELDGEKTSQRGRQPEIVAKKSEEPSFKKVEKIAKSSPVTSGGLESIRTPARAKGTYAPASAHKDIGEVIRPSKGSTVEVLVAWNNRVIETYHIDEKKTVTVGSHPKCDIILPIFGSTLVKQPLVELDGTAKIFFTSDVSGEITRGERREKLKDLIATGKAQSVGSMYQLTLQQGELVKMNINEVVIFIRYVTQAPKPVVAPILGLSASEITTLIASGVFIALLALYFAVYSSHAPTVEEKLEEPPRKATFLYKPKLDPITSPIEAEPPQDAKLAEKATAQQVKAAEKPQVPTPQKAQSRDDEGKAAEAKPNKSKSQEVKLTTPNPGTGKGVQKAQTSNAAKNDAGASSAKKDVTKTGLLSAFATKGTQDKLSQVYSGAGVAGGAAKSATGTGGSVAAGAGDTPGDGLKDIGKGGKGEATVGIAGVGTQGRGSGNEGYGTGGLGDKKGASVIPGGAEESFVGTVDRDAVKRVIQRNMGQIKACYDRALNKNPGLYGKIIINWTVVTRGTVREAGVASSTMNSSEVEQCIVSRFKTWRFPEPPAGQEYEVTYPFVFTAQN